MKKILASLLLACFCMGLSVASAGYWMGEAGTYGPVKTIVVVKEFMEINEKQEKSIRKEMWEFSNEGKLQELIVENQGEIEIHRTYDAKERLLSENGIEQIYDEKLKISQGIKDGAVTDKIFYNNQGQIIVSESRSGKRPFVAEHTYDKNGNRIRSEIQYGGGFVLEIVRSYDEVNRKNSQVWTAFNNDEILFRIVEEFDSRGFVVKWRDFNGIVTRSFIYKEVDSYGNWLERQIIDEEKGLSRTETRMITYYDDVK